MYQQLKDHFKSYTSAPEEEYDHFCSYFKPKSVKKGEYLLKAGEVCDFEAFVVKGLFKIYYLGKDDTKWILVFSAENWWVTDFESFELQIPSELNIVALEDSEILYINRADKEQSYLDNNLVYKIERFTVKKAHRGLRRRVLDKISKTAEERYLDFIKEHPTLSQRLTNLQIASYLGVTNVFVSNIRKKISKRKI